MTATFRPQPFLQRTPPRLPQRPRVLLVFPRFPDTFWALPRYRAVTGNRVLYPPLGLLTVAALLPRAWPVRLADMNVRPIDQSDWAWADIVMGSAMHAQRRGLLDVIQQARARGKTTVAGGPYPTSHPEQVLAAGCDLVVCGEGEVTVAELIQALQAGTTGRVIEAGGPADLARSPLPRYELLRMDDYLNVAIQASRGCPHACEFCDVTALFGHAIRYKPPDQVVAELDSLNRLKAPGHVFVCDDNFIAHRGRAKAILEAIIAWNRAHGEPFGFDTQCTVSLGRDAEMIDLLTAANFGQVFIGVESPDETALLAAGKTQNTRYPVAEQLDAICRNGLTVLPSFIIGLDGETKGVDRRIGDLIEQTATPIAMLNLLQAPPGTKLWQRLEQQGRLRHDVLPEEEIFSPLNFIPDRAAEDVRAEFVQAWETVYDPPRFLARAYRYYRRMRPTRSAMAKAAGRPHTGGPRRRRPSKRTLVELRVVLNLIWRQGIVASHRIQFWRQWIGMLRHNPSRMKAYLACCVMAEDMFAIRATLLARSRGR